MGTNPTRKKEKEEGKIRVPTNYIIEWDEDGNVIRPWKENKDKNKYY